MEPSDAELARAIGAPERSPAWAEAELYRRFARRIELYGLRHLGTRAAAEELVQDVLLRVLQALRAGRLQDPAKLASFVLGTCRNVTFDTRRTVRRQRKLAEDSAALETDSMPPSLSEADVLRLLGCMRQLAEREASVVRMSFWEDRSAEEIATSLGLTAGNVRVIRHRALAKLAATMNPEADA